MRGKTTTNMTDDFHHGSEAEEFSNGVESTESEVVNLYTSNESRKRSKREIETKRF